MFRPSRSSLGPPRRQIQELFSFPALWDPKFLQDFVTGTYSTYIHVVLMTDVLYLYFTFMSHLL